MNRIISFFFLTFTLGVLAQTNYGSQNNSFNPNDVGFSQNHGTNNSPGTNMGVSDIYLQPDGKILLCGGFSSYNDFQRMDLARLNPDLTIDQSFKLNFNVLSYSWVSGLLKMAIQPSGKIIIAGNYLITYGGASHKRISRLNTNGTVEAYSEGQGFNAIAEDLAMQSDGKAIAVGQFTSYQGTFCNRIIRITSYGAKDNTFNIGTGPTTPASSLYLNRVELLSDGKMLVAGEFSSWNNKPYRNLVRLNSDGSLDTTFTTGLGPIGVIKAIHELPNGKIAIGGDFTMYNGISANRFCVLNADGTRDNSFNSGNGFSSTVNTIYSDSTGKFYVGGNFATYDGNPSPYFACISSTGTWNPNFVSKFNNQIRVIKPMPDGSLLVGGQFYGFDNYAIHGLARILQTGELDTTFNRSTGANNFLTGTELFSNGDAITFGSDYEAYNGILTPSHLAKIDTVGNVYINNFTALPFDDVNVVKIDSTDHVLIGGMLKYGTAAPYKNLIRTDSNGNIDLSFNSEIPSPNYGRIWDVDRVNNGKHLVVYQVVNDLFLNRINYDGSIDSSFQMVQMTNGLAKTTILSNQKILLYGPQMTFNSSVTSSLIRLNADGTIDPGFNSGIGPNSSIAMIKELPNGKLFVGGEFETWNNAPQRGYIILNSDGSVATGYTYPLNYPQYQWVRDVETLPNGKMMISGVFGINPLTSRNVLLLYPDGSVDQNFGYKALRAEIYGYVSDLTRFDSTDFYISGSFGSVNGTGANGIERFSYHSLPMVHDTITECDSYTWINGVTYQASQDSIYYSTPSANGSDSLIMLNLIINYSSDTTLNVAVCESYYWNISNQTYYSSQTVIDTIPNYVGCDSIITLNLTIYPTYSDTLDVVQCGTYHWNQTGLDYHTSGYYPDTLQTIYGCDSILTLHLTLQNTSNQVAETGCGSYLWPINGQAYSSSGQYIDTILNAAGCDSIITLNLTIIPLLPLTIENTFSMPSDANSCVGEVAVAVSGNADFELDIDNGSQVITSSGYSLIIGLCPGVRDLNVTDNCGDTLTTQIVIPVDSNYVFNNPFIDSLAIDSLGVTVTNCDIYYNSIDTAYIDSIWASGNTVNVIWNIVDSNGSNFDTTSYVLNNGNGVYWLQLSVFCPNKSVGEYFAVTEAIYFNNGSVSTAGLSDYKQALFEVYPNPTNNNVRINFSGSDAELTVYDLQGKVVLKDRIQNQGMISLENFERGVYLFDFKNSNGQSVQRVVKQ
ncbi:hypothetical protein D3C71_552020 [compost metagenome]